MTSVQAQNAFGKLLDAVQREPVSITRHGRPTAFIVSPQDMDDLLESRKERSNAVAELEAWSIQAKDRAKPAAEALTDADVVLLIHEAR